MSTDYTKQIEARRAALEKMKTARVRAQADKENAEKRIGELQAEVRALGVEPENLEAEIAKLDQEIQNGLKLVGDMIPIEYR